MTLHTRLLLLILLATPVAAVAGGTATVQSGAKKSHQTTVEWRDTHNLRLQQAGTPGYFIMRDGKGYAVMMRNGKPMVLDVSSMGAMMQAGKDKKGFISGSFTPTGKSETVAGINGHVYHATWTDAEGQHKGDAVLTDDPRVVEMTQAYMALVDSLNGNHDDTAAKMQFPSSEPGLLRLGDNFRVLTISDETPPAKDFELPAKPMSLAELIKSGGG